MGQFNRLLDVVVILLVLIVLTASGAEVARAHPIDQACHQNKSMDPALCRALSAPNEQVILQPKWPKIQTIGLYLKLGFVHIIPRGLDHILFVLALFLASTRFKPLLLQISVFTIAHTVTLALAAMGKISVPASIIEPIIAASIALVALENVFFKNMSRWRVLIVFGFGLAHGLGFAGALADLGLPKDQFYLSLISFNLGVESGQLSVIVLAFLVLHKFYHKPWYRQMVVVPISFVIGAIGLIWAVQRLL